MKCYRRGKWLTAAVALLGMLMLGTAKAENVIKIGAVAAKTGPLAGGTAVTHWPNVKLWVEQVNARGGLKLKNGRAKIELIEYDDQTNPGESIKAVQRLATQDKVDFIIAPYGTGINLAVAPVFDKYGYPQIAVTAITDQIGELTQRYPNLFFTLGSTTAFVKSVVDILDKLRSEGKIGNRIAMANVADAFGIELATIARPAFEKAGYEIVYDKSYPLGTQDLSPIVKGAKAASPDAFIAWSYPPDTFGLTQQAIIQDLDVKVFYTAVATSFPAYGGKFGSAVEGNLGAGGVNPDTPEMQAYIKAHKEVTGKAPDFWASATVYSSLQILEQAIEGVGEPDRAAVSDYLKRHTFKTVLGDIAFNHQNNEKYWTVGQWQNGVFYGVASTGRPGAKPVKLKNGWK
ncbi:MAG: amino acid ABC transporter substrate-binding protein [Gammaproteobacteria bacterium]